MITKTDLHSILAAGVLVLALTSSCKHTPESVPDPNPDDTLVNTRPCHPDTVYFVNTILPLLQSGCALSGCHNEASARDGVILTDYARILTTGEVKPGNPGESKLYKVMIDDDPDDRMPPPPMQAFTAEQIDRVRTWILQGAKNNRCIETQCDSINVSFASHVFPVIQNQCMGCHSGSAPQGGILLSGYDAIASVANTGRLLGAIQHQSGFSAMPPSSKLDDCKIAIIKKWISDGTPNN